MRFDDDVCLRSDDAKTDLNCRQANEARFNDGHATTMATTNAAIILQSNKSIFTFDHFGNYRTLKAICQLTFSVLCFIRSITHQIQSISLTLISSIFDFCGSCVADSRIISNFLWSSIHSVIYQFHVFQLFDESLTISLTFENSFHFSSSPFFSENNITWEKPQFSSAFDLQRWAEERERENGNCM